MRPLFLFIAILISCSSFAQQKQQPNNFIRPLPKPAKAVNDFGKFLTSSEVQYLEKELMRYHGATTNAIAIITLDSLTDPNTKKQYTIEEAALSYFNKWGLGDKTKNNGVLIMASRKPRGVRIEVGKGLETILSNQICQQIINEKLVPNFKQGLFFTGFKEAITALENQLDKNKQAAIINDIPATNDNTGLQPGSEQQVYSSGITQSSMWNSFSPVAWIFIAFIILFFGAILLKITGVGGPSGVFTGSGYRNNLSGQRLLDHQHNLNNSSLASSGIDASPSGSGSSSDSFSGGSSNGGGASGNW